MENKINIAELLKDCPRGMELDCTIFDDVYFDYIDDVSDIINCYIQDSTKKIGISFSKYGCYSSISKSKCVIFPKGKTTWEGFQRPFKDGDVCYVNFGKYYENIFIFKEISKHAYIRRYVNLHCNSLLTDGDAVCKINDVKEFRHATEEEKEILFQAIKDNGYKWNEETKTLEKLIEPKFKVGDKIRHKTTNKDDIYEISKVYDDSYGLVGFTWMIYMKYQDQYELIPNKFDITTLKPFDKVLVRLNNDNQWYATWFSHVDEIHESYGRDYVTVAGKSYTQMIPYKNNEHLLGTTNDCDEYYKTWE